MFARDRADLGPAHAAQQAAAEAARYATPRPLDQVLAELRQAWTAEQNCLDRLAFWQPQRDTLRHVAALEAAHAAELTGLDADVRQTALAPSGRHTGRRPAARRSRPKPAGSATACWPSGTANATLPAPLPGSYSPARVGSACGGPRSPAPASS